MKLRICLALLCLVLLSGCSGVLMNAQYSTLLDQTVAVSKETAVRADAGQLTSVEMVAALKVQASVWQRFKDARDGKAGE